MEKKIAVITGATGGIGSIVCKYLVTNNYKVYAACRNEAKAVSLRNAIAEAVSQKDLAENLIFIPLNLASFKSVDAFCSTILTSLSGAPVDLLINNAGIIAPEYIITGDGYESSMQVNYLSARRIIETFLPHLRGKIINTVSCTIRTGRYAEPEKQSPSAPPRKENSFRSLKHYSNSKLMLSVYTILLHNTTGDHICVCGVDPGIVDTGIITMHRWYDPLANLFFRPLIKTPEQGAIPMIQAIEYNAPETGPVQKNPLLFAGKKQRRFPAKVFRLAQSLLSAF